MQATRAAAQARPLQQQPLAAATAASPAALRRRGCRRRRLVAAAAASAPSPAPPPPSPAGEQPVTPAALPRSALLRRLAPASLLGAAAAALFAPLPRPAAAAGEEAAAAATAAAAAAPSSLPRALLPDELAALRCALAAAAPKPKSPVLLRLVFHDAGTYDAAAGDGGANASVRLELDRPENGGLKRGWRVIQAIRAELDKQQQQRQKQGNAAGADAAPTDLASLLSDADLIALAGAHAVEITGGPQDLLASVRVGRSDAQKPDPEGRLPSEQATPQELMASFAAKSLSADEMVALSGAHTLGSKGFGDMFTFDNAYYTTLVAKPWEDPRTQMPEMIGLPSDRALPSDAECAAAIGRYAADQALFFADFSRAYVRLTELGAVWR